MTNHITNKLTFGFRARLAGIALALATFVATPQATANDFKFGGHPYGGGGITLHFGKSGSGNSIHIGKNLHRKKSLRHKRTLRHHRAQKRHSYRNEWSYRHQRARKHYRHRTYR